MHQLHRRCFGGGENAATGKRLVFCLSLHQVCTGFETSVWDIIYLILSISHIE